MTEFTIGNICKEIQRIQYDLEQYGDITSAIDRCKSLDELLCEIEDGGHHYRSWEKPSSIEDFIRKGE